MPRRETLVVKTHRASLSNIQLVLDVFGRYHDVASVAPSVGSLADEALLRRLCREWQNARSNLGSDICYHIATHCAPPANRPDMGHTDPGAVRPRSWQTRRQYAMRFAMRVYGRRDGRGGGLEVSAGTL